MVRAPDPDKIPINSPQDLHREVDALADALLLNETEDTWEKIHRAVKRFQATVRGGACRFPDSFVGHMRDPRIAKGLVRSLVTERTALSGTTLELVASCTRLGPDFAALLPVYLPTVLRLLARPHRVYVTRAAACLATILRNTRLADVLRFLVLEWRNEPGKSATFREQAAAALALALGADTDTLAVDRDGLERRMDDIEWLIRTGATGREASVRADMKKCWEVYKREWPERVASFTAPMTPTIRKYLKVTTTDAAPSASTSTSTSAAAMRPAPRTATTRPGAGLSASTGPASHHLPSRAATALSKSHGVSTAPVPSGPSHVPARTAVGSHSTLTGAARPHLSASASARTAPTTSAVDALGHGPVPRGAARVEPSRSVSGGPTPAGGAHSTVSSRSASRTEDRDAASTASTSTTVGPARAGFKPTAPGQVGSGGGGGSSRSGGLGPAARPAMRALPASSAGAASGSSGSAAAGANPVEPRKARRVAPAPTAVPLPHPPHHAVPSPTATTAAAEGPAGAAAAGPRAHPLVARSTGPTSSVGAPSAPPAHAHGQPFRPKLNAAVAASAAGTPLLTTVKPLRPAAGERNRGRALGAGPPSSSATPAAAAAAAGAVLSSHPATTSAPLPPPAAGVVAAGRPPRTAATSGTASSRAAAAGATRSAPSAATLASRERRAAREAARVAEKEKEKEREQEREQAQEQERLRRKAEEACRVEVEAEERARRERERVRASEIPLPPGTDTLAGSEHDGIDEEGEKVVEEEGVADESVVVEEEEDDADLPPTSEYEPTDVDLEAAREQKEEDEDSVDAGVEDTAAHAGPVSDATFATGPPSHNDDDEPEQQEPAPSSEDTILAEDRDLGPVSADASTETSVHENLEDETEAAHMSAIDAEDAPEPGSLRQSVDEDATALLNQSTATDGEDPALSELELECIAEQGHVEPAVEASEASDLLAQDAPARASTEAAFGAAATEVQGPDEPQGSPSLAGADARRAAREEDEVDKDAPTRVETCAVPSLSSTPMGSVPIAEEKREAAIAYASPPDLSALPAHAAAAPASTPAAFTRPSPPLTPAIATPARPSIRFPVSSLSYSPEPFQTASIVLDTPPRLDELLGAVRLPARVVLSAAPAMGGVTTVTEDGSVDDEDSFDSEDDGEVLPGSPLARKTASPAPEVQVVQAEAIFLDDAHPTSGYDDVDTTWEADDSLHEEDEDHNVDEEEDVNASLVAEETDHDGSAERIEDSGAESPHEYAAPLNDTIAYDYGAAGAEDGEVKTAYDDSSAGEDADSAETTRVTRSRVELPTPGRAEAPCAATVVAPPAADASLSLAATPVSPANCSSTTQDFSFFGAPCSSTPSSSGAQRKSLWEVSLLGDESACFELEQPQLRFHDETESEHEVSVASTVLGPLDEVEAEHQQEQQREQHSPRPATPPAVLQRSLRNRVVTVPLETPATSGKPLTRSMRSSHRGVLGELQH